jgi:maltose alpha-D-glucosyltransferase / alpha-amylase
MGHNKPMDPLWYRDAVIYQLHVKAYCDANDDGIGDFAGLTEKLDYVQALGVDTLWLLPFYPSPLRDDGYDISDYRGIHPSYGTLRDFRHFVREAHNRGLRVITELVINHTSDQHPWFQRARAARPGTAHRNYYVWSLTNRTYAGTRIIFTDTEKSNWAWDEQAQAYYWHRFFSHQPDLNFDNPRVVREVIAAMRWWLDMGVDGLRLDAVPYLCEREGTSNENLPETHAILKVLRRAMDQSHSGRVFLAEANQWPEDVLPYFGDGDECHMAFHFPLMPRIYMAIAAEDRHPITDILHQTPEIPAGCQWAIFLRNHDELTLEMVTDRERDYLWATYAADRRARINLGIRRRLAPLMENDRRKIELMNSLLLSMPGTPVLYYGDEIGMGDNVYLGDRNGVRTPMQWNQDRNGGFSRADPASLYLPPIMDPVYGYTALNVEAQERNSSSLLNWMKRIVSIRRGNRCFGRGALRFLFPSNRKALAYLREFESETILCVANLAHSAQGLELDLSGFSGRVPVDMFGRSAFPVIGAAPYFLTLPGYGFYWFHLAADVQPPAWQVQNPALVIDPVTLVVREGLADLVGGACRRSLEREILPQWLKIQRWSADKNAATRSVELMRWAPLATSRGAWLLAMVAVTRPDGQARTYNLPLAIGWDEAEDSGGATLARLRRGARVGALRDAFSDEAFLLALVQLMRDGAVVAGSDGTVVGHATRALAEIELSEAPEVRVLTVEQSNSSAVVGGAVVVKLLRQPVIGANPEVDMGRFLTETSRFVNTPPLLGWIDAADASGRSSVLAIMHAYIRNQGDAWEWMQAHLGRFLDEADLLPPATLVERMAGGMIDDALVFADLLGRRTAEMHRALAQVSGDPDFDPQPVTMDDLQRWQERAVDQARQAVAALAHSDLPEAAAVVAGAERLYDAVAALVPGDAAGILTRIHGDYHLGQVLIATGDVHIIDFEGEAIRPLGGRRALDSPLRDVAGMLRSFDYAAAAALQRRPDSPRLASIAADWRHRLTSAFLAAYGITMNDQPLIALFALDKACGEVLYEASHRPAWVALPIRALLAVVEG